MDHAVALVEAYLRVNGHLQDRLPASRGQIGHRQIKDPTLGLLALVEKSGRASHHLGAPR